jgi:MFS family permease
VENGGVGIAKNWVMPIMSIGQIAEILTMLFLGTMLKHLGWKWTMVIGILGHVVRFALYAMAPQSPVLIILVQILHGICYAFFFATVYIFVEEYFPKNARTSAQGLFNVMILGVGALIAGFVCPTLFAKMKVGEMINFRSLFIVPMCVALFGAMLLALFFRPPAKAQTLVGSEAGPAH